MYLLKRSVWMFLLLCLGCSAQSAAPSDVAKRVERQVRYSFEVPPEVKVTVGEGKPSEFTGYDTVPITFTQGDRSTTHDFLLAKDGKTLLRVTRMDLTADPFAALMSKIDVSGRPVRGNKDAKVTVVVYDDFQCPYCQRMYSTLFREVFPAYADRIKVIFKDYPLAEIHPWATRAAVNANCLAAQNGEAYWDFSDRVHYTQGEINTKPEGQRLASLDALALEFGKKHNLDAAKLQACIKAQDDRAIKAAVAEGDALGVSGTPAIFINGRKLGGAVPAPDFRAVLDSALREAGQSAPVAAQSSPAAPQTAAPAAARPPVSN